MKTQINESQLRRIIREELINERMMGWMHDILGIRHVDKSHLEKTKQLPPGWATAALSKDDETHRHIFNKRLGYNIRSRSYDLNFDDIDNLPQSCTITWRIASHTETIKYNDYTDVADLIAEAMNSIDRIYQKKGIAQIPRIIDFQFESDLTNEIDKLEVKIKSVIQIKLNKTYKRGPTR